jgi:hypothetical protein
MSPGSLCGVSEEEEEEARANGSWGEYMPRGIDLYELKSVL